MPLNDQLLTNKTSLYSVLNTLQDTINYNLNCVKIATVVSFNKETMTACCRVNNKRLVQLKNDGNQVLRDYPLIYARVHFIGWGEIGATFPINEGMEGFLLFNDRELETWFITGEAGNLAYDRCHDLSDAIFICGLHSQPSIPLLKYLENCLNLYYKNTNIQLYEDKINLNTTTTNITSNISQTGNNTIVGTLTADGVNDTTAANGTFVSKDDKLITVVNGIVKTIEPQ